MFDVIKRNKRCNYTIIDSRGDTCARIVHKWYLLMCQMQLEIMQMGAAHNSNHLN
jgi:hypothetical protein